MAQHDAHLEGARVLDPNSVEEARALELVGQRVGNYVIERPLARGGMGSVFVARHPQIGREVAVKFLDQDVSAHADMSRRFLDEAQLTASLNHPNIVDILDFGELNGRLYYVMELLRGRSLRAQMNLHGRFTEEELKAYLEQMCKALEMAHTAGIVHRDLKPGNVFVLESEPLRVKLLDFGVAKLMAPGAGQTRHGQVLGTPSHMAPEQAMGDVKNITPRTDIYALGVIAYEMLTGFQVFQHESAMMLLVMHVRDPVIPIRQRVPEIHWRVADVIEACLCKEPNARPQSARILFELFTEALRSKTLVFEARQPAGERVARDAGGHASPLPEAANSGNEETVAHSVRLSGEPTLLAAEPRFGSPALAVEPPAPPAREKARLPLAVPVSVTLCAVADAAPLPAEAPASVHEVRIPTEADERAAELAHANTLHSAEDVPPAPRKVEAPLTASAESILNKLLLRMKRKGDFPAFAQSVGEVSKKADADGAYSAGQLGESILKDYALTAKLLRIVNSMYANRFGGKVYSVQHAIVLLGFDRIRSLALSISLFKGSGKNAQSARISDSAIGSLVSGEIARNLAGSAKVNDEEAMVCAMFRDLGRHLVVVYLPELYDQILEHSARERVSVRAASERVIGTSFAKLGSAVAQSWRLPPRLLNAVAAVPTSGGALTRPEDRLCALAEFANELCEIVASESDQTRERAVSALLAQHSKLLSIDPDELPELLASVKESFQERYASLLGLDVKSSRFLKRVTMLAQVHGAVRAPGEARPGAALEPVSPAQPAIGAPARAAADTKSGMEARPKIARLELVKRGGASEPSVNRLDLVKEVSSGAPVADLETRIAEVKAALTARLPSDYTLGLALGIWVEQLGVARALLLTAEPAADVLSVRFGIADDIDALAKEFRIPLKSSRTASNVFASAHNSGKDLVVPDAFSPRAAASVPVRYYEALGSPAFAIYGCVHKGVPPALVLVDVESAEKLPAPERVQALAALRPLLAQAAAARV